MKFIHKHTVYHIVEIDASKKAHQSQETNLGISVSEVPHSWQRIARVSGDLYRFTNPNGKFLDRHKLTRKDKEIIFAWADDHGLVEATEIFVFSYYDDEWEEEMHQEFETREDAEEEAEMYDAEVTSKQAYKATSKLNSIIGWEIEPIMVEDYLVILYAHENLDVDGVWFNDRLDSSRLSAPRGTIFDEGLKNWTIEKIDMNEAEDKEE